MSGNAGVGTGTVAWDGRDDRGMRVPAGVYTVVLDAGGESMKVKTTVVE